MATLSAPLLLVWLSVYANHHWLVTEPEAFGLPGWQTGAKALSPYCQSSQACKPIHRAPTWLTTALVEWNALHAILAPGGMTDIVCHNAPDEYIRPCSCYVHQSGAC